MNDHYTRDYAPPTGTRVASSDLINEFQSVEAGFDSVQTDFGYTLHQASGTAIAAMPNAVSRALKVLGFDADGNPIALALTEVADAVAKTGDTMLGFLTLHAAPSNDLHAATKLYVDKSTATVSSGGTLAATKGVRYLIAANGVTLTAPTSLAKGDVHGVRVMRGVTGFVWDFGATKVRGGTPGTLEWNLGAQGLDLVYEDATRGFV